MDAKTQSHHFELTNGSRIAVIGGGPAGSFFSYFLLNMADRIDLELKVDIYDSRDFSAPGPPGCNMCGGIISESLVQTLAMEGIELPSSVVQRGIESYMLHMDAGSVPIQTPTRQKRIGAIYRGAGPRGLKEAEWSSFDGYLLGLAQKKGARFIRGRLETVEWKNGYPEIQIKGGSLEKYDLVAVAAGVNSSALKLFQDLDMGYSPPKTTKTFICEYFLGRETIEDYLGNSMHTFLLDLPRLEFAAIVPKGDYVTVCLLGNDIDNALIQAFLTSSEVRNCLPPGLEWNGYVCKCMPRMTLKGSKQAYMERVVFIGDCGVSRLYKDGIGAAYRTAKAAVASVLFEGVSAESFKEHGWKSYQKIESDNSVGKIIFMAVGLFQKLPLMRRAILRMVSNEQKKVEGPRRMSVVLWDMFTGSAPYKEILVRMLHPFFLVSFTWNILASIQLIPRRKR